jgi:predicted negative regulator of RcsB-dependent stress response
LEHAGDIYFQAGNAVQALAYWQQALERIELENDTKNDRRPILTRKIKLKKYLKE